MPFDILSWLTQRIEKLERDAEHNRVTGHQTTGQLNRHKGRLETLETDLSKLKTTAIRVVEVCVVLVILTANLGAEKVGEIIAGLFRAF